MRKRSKRILSNKVIRQLARQSARETLASETVEEQDALVALALELANIEVALLIEAIGKPTQEVAA